MNTLTVKFRSLRAFSARTFRSSRLLVALLSLAALAFTAPRALATTYYFSAAGSDDNPGTDSGAPKRSLAAAAALALPGNTLLFKRGDTWYNPSASFDLRNKSGTATEPIVIDAYDVGEKPVIAALRRIDDAAWSNVAGTTTWQASVTGFSDAWRLFVDGVSKYKVNTSNAAANESSVDQPHEWYIKAAPGGGTVFVNTGSATVGPVNAEIHPVGSVSTLLMKNTNYLTIRNLDLRGGSQFNVVYVEAPSSNLAFDHNTIQRAMGSGLLVTNLASATTEWVSNVTITNNLIDKIWTTQENDPQISALTGDGIFILHAVDTGLIKGNVVRNWGHVGITLSSYRAGFHGVHNIVVEDNDVSAGASGYMHALDVDGFENLTTHNVVRRNFFHDYTSTSHIQGNDNKYYSNIFVGVTLTTQPKQSQQPWAADLIPWQYTDGNWMAAHDNYIVNNTFVDVRQYPLVLGDDPANPNVVGNNVVANNIVYRYALNGSSGLALNVTNAVRGPIYVRNNNFWNFSDTAAVVRYLNPGAPNYTAAQLNAAFPQTCSGNVQVDPGFAGVATRDFRLTSGSPDAVKSGGLNLSAVMGAGFTDFAGNPWHPTNPSMGAFQAPSTDQNLSAGKAVTYSAVRSGESTGNPPSYLTDGDTSLAHLVAVGNAGQLVSATIDLGQVSSITRVKMWHYWGDARKYKDVIVQLSASANFSSGVTTVFNNDTDNSAGFGVGTDAEYPETSAGKEVVLFTPISARYVRYFIAGNSVNAFNHYVELQAFGFASVPAAPTITASPSSRTVNLGDSVSFRVVAVGSTPFTYQWRKDGVAIAGATAASFALPAALTTDAGSYDVVVTNAVGSATSPGAVLTVNTPIPPEPSLSLGKPVTYSAIRSGESSGTPVSYLTDGDTSLTHLVAVGNAGQLVSATVNLGQVSAVARVRMWHYWGDARKYKDVIVQLSTSADFASGVTTVFNNDADNSAGFGVGADAEYAETPTGKEIVLGTPVLAQYARFFIAGNSVNAFNHYVELQVFGSVVNPPAITSAPSGRTATVGDSVTLSVTAEGDAPLSYQWRKAGVAIAGATGPVYSLASVHTADAGIYDVVVSNPAGAITSASATLIVDKAVATVALGNLAQTFDGAPRAPLVATTPTGLGYGVTYDGQTQPPIAAGSYSVAVTVTDPDYAGTATGTLVVAPAAAQITLGGLAHTYDGAPHAVTLSTSPVGVPCVVTYNGSAIPPSDAGSYTVVADVTDPNYTGTASAALTIERAAATITLAGLWQAYDGTSRAVTATTVPADLPVAFTYDGSPSAPVIPGRYTVAATVTDANYTSTVSDTLVVTVTAWVRHLTSLNGGLDGSAQVIVPESVTLNGDAWLSGDLLVPGTPTIRLNGSPVFGGTLDGAGSADPTGHAVTLNGHAVARHVVRRIDPRNLPTLVPPSSPSGTRDVALNSVGQNPGDFATLRNLTLNGSAGEVAVPAGTYGKFVVNGGATLVLGSPASDVSAVYDLQGLTVNGNGRVVIAGPVVLNVASSVNVNGSINATGAPAAFELNVVSGGLTLNGGVIFRGDVAAPAGTITINGDALLEGEVIADRLTINGTGKLQAPAN